MLMVFHLGMPCTVSHTFMRHVDILALLVARAAVSQIYRSHARTCTYVRVRARSRSNNACAVDVVTGAVCIWYIGTVYTCTI